VEYKLNKWCDVTSQFMVITHQYQDQEYFVQKE